MLTTYNEVDMSAIMEIRAAYKDAFEKKHGVKMGFMSFFVKACCHALKEVPEVNAEIDGDEVVYKRFVHMGVAVGTPTGPRCPGRARCRSERLRPDREGHRRTRRQGPGWQACHGRHAGRHLHHLERRRLWQPHVLAHPEPAAVRQSSACTRSGSPRGGRRTDRDPPDDVSGVSYDHRIVDGKGAVTFLVRVKEALEDPRRLLMDV